MIVWLERALIRFEKILDWIDGHDPRAADDLEARVHESLEHIDAFPRLAEKKTKGRYFVIPPLIVIYRVKREGRKSTMVEVIDVLHERQRR